MTLPDLPAVVGAIHPPNIRSASHLSTFVASILEDSGVPSGVITETPMPPITTWDEIRSTLRRRDENDNYIAGFEQWYVWVGGGAKPLRSDIELIWHETREVNVYGMAALGAYSDSRQYIQERGEEFVNYSTQRSTRQARRSLEPYISLPRELRARFWHGPVGEMHFYQTSITFPLQLELGYTRGRQ